MAWQWDRHSGPHLPNIFVGFYEKKIPEEEYPRMYFRFVDDVFSYFANQSKSVEFFERLNGLHEALRFTQEGEQECSLPFLDVKVSRTDNGIITSMYRKPTFTVAILRGTRSAPPAIKSTSCVHWRTGYFGFVHPLSSTRSWRPCAPFCQKMATLAISWPSWLQEILLDVALVLDSVLLFFKYNGWERERTSWSEKRIMRFV